MFFWLLDGRDGLIEECVPLLGEEVLEEVDGSEGDGLGLDLPRARIRLQDDCVVADEASEGVDALGLKLLRCLGQAVDVMVEEFEDACGVRCLDEMSPEDVGVLAVVGEGEELTDVHFGDG